MICRRKALLAIVAGLVASVMPRQEQTQGELVLDIENAVPQGALEFETSPGGASWFLAHDWQKPSITYVVYPDGSVIWLNRRHVYVSTADLIAAVRKRKT